MPARGTESDPEYPEPPPGVARMDHPATVEASIRYWEAIRLRAIKANDPGLERTATALKNAYEAARRGPIKGRKTRGRPESDSK